MANEILVNYTSGVNLVAVITNNAGLTYAGGNTFAARNNTTVLAHPVTVPEFATSGQYAADFPAAITTRDLYWFAVYSVATPGVITLAEVQARPVSSSPRGFKWSGTREETDTYGFKKGTAFTAFEFPMVLSSDHVSPGTGLSVTGQVSIDGAAFVALTNSPITTEIGATGIYKVNFAAADTNGNSLTFKFAATGCDPTLIGMITEA